MQHVVITGASRGLGKSMAIDFAADGWTVSGCGTDAAALQSLQTELGPDHLLQVCDVTNPASVEKFAAAAIKQSVAPDLVINNAATINRNAPLWEVSAEDRGRTLVQRLVDRHPPERFRCWRRIGNP